MWKTVLLLIITFVVVPVIALKFDTPLTEFQEITLYKLFWLYVFLAFLCFVVSQLSKNYSQVDKLWSILPAVYVWMIWSDNMSDPRELLMAILVTIWSVRLTFNFSRRGGYSWKIWEGKEDYRWAVLRERKEFQGAWAWFFFNLVFISFYQMGLILLFTLPALKSAGGSPLNAVDVILAVLFVFFVVMETIADQQQWTFQNEKYRQLGSGKPLQGMYAKGFVHTGLWGIVRHPNYGSEQAIWIVFYLFSVNATGSWVNWSMVGCLLLLVLFKGSSDFSEEISSKKYPDYASYQKNVPRFIPFAKGFKKS